MKIFFALYVYTFSVFYSLYSNIHALITFTRKGCSTSGALFLTFLVDALCKGILLRTELMRYQEIKTNEEMIRILLAFALVLGSGIMFFLNCWADEISDRDIIKADNACPHYSASFLNRLYFSWCTPLIFGGLRKALSSKELWDLLPDFRTEEVAKSFDKDYYITQDIQTKATFKKEKGGEAIVIMTPKKSVLPSLIKTFGPTFFAGAFLKLCSDLLSLYTPTIMKMMIAFAEAADSEGEWKGYFYGVFLLAVVTLQSILLNQYFEKMFVLGLKMRTSLISAVYRKALNVTQATKKDSSIGEIVNIMSVDVQRFMDLLPYLNMLWSAPLQIVISAYFMYIELGWATFVGMGILFATMPLNFYLGKYMRKFQMTQMKIKDKRIKAMNEILNGIKVLKLYAWEESFIGQILDLRSKEIAVQKKAAYMNAVMSLFWTVAPFIVGLGAFTAYVMNGHNLTASNAFVTLSYLNIMRMPLAMLPMMLVFLIQCNVSLKRINKFMNNEEIDPFAVSHEESSNAVEIDNASFHWDMESPTVLKDINIKIPKGSLTAIVGTVGSGKSSLLSALLGELHKVQGRVNTNGRIAYVPQQAWIQNSTLKENITFCQDDDKQKYEQVIESCALKTDLEILTAGDQTEIGEKGINLSGGQKQRVSLARAVYSQADLYLLDDPLSAVDSHVGKHIFSHVIGPSGVLNGTTRLLVTHGITFLPETDHIIVLTDGQVSEQGSYQELLQKKGNFSKFLMEYMTDDADSDFVDEIKEQLKNTLGEKEFKKQISRRDSVSSTSSYGSGSQSSKTKLSKKSKDVDKDIKDKDTEEEKKKPPANTGSTLIEKENMETGSVKLRVYWYYVKAVGIIGFSFVALFQILFTTSTIMANYWLNWWVEDKFDNGYEFYLSIYGGIGAFQAVAVMLLMGVFGLTTLNGSKVMHKNMLMRVMMSPMSFFDTTPLGRIVNRFAKDVDVCDALLPSNMRAWLSTFASFMGTMISIITVLPLIIVLFVPAAIIFFLIQKLYVTSSRQLKRLESVSRSPIYSHFGETLSGAPTIRAFGRKHNFINQSNAKVDYNSMCYYPSLIANRWLAVRLETIGNLITFGSAVFCILSKGSISQGDVGFVISYSLSITQILNWLVRMTADVETNIVGVERIMEYSELPQEAPWMDPSNRTKDTWPASGDIELNNLGIRYREGLDLVIHEVSCSIKGGQKIGIVGRTGAGKSSLTVALFRIVEAAIGKIIIDGVDISKIGLHDLRKQLTIIPQDPVLFSGSLRMNLDPFNKYSDNDIWRALQLSNLHDFVKGLEEGLNFEVSEGGENLSVGQRQLVCLARALLRKTKVLVLDEATAAVDLETDDLIQNTIRNQFSDCTVLTIAHRLNTIMDYDKIMVLDKGELKEFDSPENLLKDTQGIFYSLAKDAGLADTDNSDQYIDEHL